MLLELPTFTIAAVVGRSRDRWAVRDKLTVPGAHPGLLRDLADPPLGTPGGGA